MRFGGVAFVALLLCAPAMAAEIENAQSLDIAVRGRVVERCTLADLPDVSFGDISRPGLGFSTHVGLSCNVPINVTIRSQNGGLANELMPTGQGPYAGTLPYALQVRLPVRTPERGVVSQRFASRDLVAGQSISSAGGIAVDGMSLTIALGSPGREAGLLAGRYGEVIEITVTPG
ncbi:MAG: hypothetical protein KF780_08960 [Sphingomonas sp.]|nr:hypothetical protein [Sphingomonas sp.]